ncbi:MAG: glycoside hydrolase family 92 protein [Armatimonadetes bacterium]|nr:glycoside hydrolase family 92 protein [Armatimonadota bacterium]
MSLLQYVDPLQGTYSHYQFSTGNTLPIMAMPYGMAHWTIQTDNVRGWFFNPLTPKIQGIRCTHQPSPWMGDYGAFTVLPQVGKRLISCGKRATAFRLEKSTIKPHHIEVELIGSGTKLSVSPTVRGAIFRFDFSQRAHRRVIFEGTKGETHFSLEDDNRTIVGYTRGNSGGVPENFAHYFVAVLDADVTSSSAFKDDEFIEGSTGDAIGFCVELADGDAPVSMRVATSFISLDQAKLNLKAELETQTFDSVLADAENEWENLLGTIQVESDDVDRLRTFYSCFYRTKLFPRVWHEIDASGEMVHFSPYDGQVHDGPLYADTGFWDTYRTLFPLMTILEPDRHSEVLRGFVNAYHESGWLPQWPSPGHRVCMPGTHLDVTIADSVAKGLTDFDVAAALDGMVRHADNPVGDGPYGAGRDNIAEYLQHGYVLATSHASVSQSLDYAYDDWCIGQVATYLGQSDLADRMNARALNYQKLWDPSVGFMRARHADGSWMQPFDQFAWGGPYCEGGPWQSSWAIQHDPKGLMDLLGGPEALTAKMDEMLSLPPRFACGGYSQEIHEITEMAVADFGQYAHSNQPVHHVLFLYAAAGRMDRLQFETRRILEEYYQPTTLPGDEDNGEMCAWYVLCTLGFYPFCPGRAEYILASPLFPRATVSLPNGKSLTVLAHGSGRYVSTVKLNGTELQTTISHQDLVSGGTLEFTMSDRS